MSGDEMVYPGLWECGQCKDITDTTHFYMDRATGEMQHERNPAYRKKAAERCGWRFYDGYGPPYRCDFSHGHHTTHHAGGGHPVKWSEDRFSGARPPYDPSTANEAATETDVTP